jgi:pimeloyl-ACP methyl ester carboxylesterase
MRATVDGTALFFDVVGGGLEVDGHRLRARPTVVVVHGGPGFDHGYLRPGLAPLADRGAARVRRPARAGPLGAGACQSVTLERMADDVAALCELLGIERPIVFGHSAGGFVALHLALRHPHVAGGLILCATSPGFVPARRRRSCRPGRSSAADVKLRSPRSGSSPATSPPTSRRRSGDSSRRSTRDRRTRTSPPGSSL